MFKTDYVKQGIYFLFLKGELQYIGKSVSVFSRIAQHEREFEYDSVWFMPVRGGKRELAEVEGQLIYIFAPPCNTQGLPTGKDIKLSAETRFYKAFDTSYEAVVSRQFTLENGEVDNGIEYYGTPIGEIGFWTFPFYLGSTLVPRKFGIEEVAKYAERDAFWKGIDYEMYVELSQKAEERLCQK